MFIAPIKMVILGLLWQFWFTLWLFRHGFSMAHGNRWFTELKNGDVPWQTVK